MKFKFLKYVYLVNDLTNLALKRDRTEWRSKYERLLVVLAFVSGALMLSIALNFYLYLNQ